MSDKVFRKQRHSSTARRTPEVEIRIGARLRTLRMAKDVSQAALGKLIGVSCQQIQKYEKGTDRIAASTLQVLAASLRVHPGSFFEGDMTSPSGSVPDTRPVSRQAEALQRISNDRLRKHLAALIDQLAEPT
jgi:transcriptional regulator with XRE-family HTH domain